MIVTTKICGRCLGTGKHSFNLKDGDVCYGCGGSGKVAISPKGQKKIQPDVTSTTKAKVGDILEHGCVLYTVDEIRWIKYIDGGLHGNSYNQRLVVTRLVDGKKFSLKRAFVGYDPDGSIKNLDGTPAATLIHTPEELVGTVCTPDQYVRKEVAS